MASCAGAFLAAASDLEETVLAALLVPLEIRLAAAAGGGAGKRARQTRRDSSCFHHHHHPCHLARPFADSCACDYAVRPIAAPTSRQLLYWHARHAAHYCSWWAFRCAGGVYWRRPKNKEGQVLHTSAHARKTPAEEARTEAAGATCACLATVRSANRPRYSDTQRCDGEMKRMLVAAGAAGRCRISGGYRLPCLAISDCSDCLRVHCTASSRVF